MNKSFSETFDITQAINRLDSAEAHIESLRSKHDMDGNNNCCDLDVVLSYAVGRILEAKKELNELLSKYPGAKIPLNWRR